MIDRKLFTDPFSEDYLPSWPCPTCDRGKLKLQKGSFFASETATSRKERYDEPWDPMMVDERFVVMAKCDGCGEPVTLAGRTYFEPEMTSEGYSARRRLVLEYAHPPIPIFPVSSKWPAEVAADIRSSFTLFWIDPSAAANSIRKAIEDILDSQRVPRRRLKRGVRLLPRSLHDRIELYRQQRPQLADGLLAVKWIGNSGSHAKITADDIFDAYDVLAHTLDELFERRGEQIAKLVKGINKSRGPRPRRKPR